MKKMPQGSPVLSERLDRPACCPSLQAIISVDAEDYDMLSTPRPCSRVVPDIESLSRARRGVSNLWRRGPGHE
jgi:hypothetical protein